MLAIWPSFFVDFGHILLRMRRNAKFRASGYSVVVEIITTTTTTVVAVKVQKSPWIF